MHYLRVLSLTREFFLSVAEAVCEVPVLSDKTEALFLYENAIPTFVWEASASFTIGTAIHPYVARLRRKQKPVY